MTEAGWLESSDPNTLLDYLRGKASDRKLRLFAVETCHYFSELIARNFPLEPTIAGHKSSAYLHVWGVAERFVEGRASQAELNAAYDGLQEESNLTWLEYAFLMTATKSAWEAADQSLHGLRMFYHADLPPAEAAEDPVAVAELYAVDEDEDDTYAWQTTLLRCVFGNPFRPVSIDPAWLTPDVKQLAEAIYDDRAFDLLPVLADALEDAGWHDPDILNHCRQPGEHVRGCWVVDLILGKE
jgi:hypothetical protein